MAKAAFWTVTDTEARKRGEQTGLDTLVVHAVNDDKYFLASFQLFFSISKSHLIYNPNGSLLFFCALRKSTALSALPISHLRYWISAICKIASSFLGSRIRIELTILIASSYFHNSLSSSISSMSSSGI